MTIHVSYIEHEKNHRYLLFFLRNLQIILPSHIRFKKPFFSDPKEKTHQDFHGKNKKIPASDAEDWKRRLNALKHLQGLVLGCSSDVPWMSQATKIWGNKRMGFGAAFFFHEFLNRMKVLSWINLHYWCVASVLADRTTTKKIVDLFYLWDGATAFVWLSNGIGAKLRRFS